MKKVLCTESDYKFFVKECKKWSNQLGLSDWRIYYDQIEMDSYGSCSLNCANRTATIGFCKEWGKSVVHPKTKENISRTALHEMLHVAVHHLEWLAETRVVAGGEIDNAVEALVVRLTNFYLKRD